MKTETIRGAQIPFALPAVIGSALNMMRNLARERVAAAALVVPLEELQRLAETSPHLLADIGLDASAVAPRED